MGDIAFNIEKFVDLNKVVNLDIDKLVNVNVNNPDILATAEADAEAFGPFALAEVDAYTYVSREGEPQTTFAPGEIDVLGNTSFFDLTGDIDVPDGLPGEDGTVAAEITLNFTTNVQPENVPDVDDVNGFGKLEPLTAPPPDIADAPLPQTGVLEITDLNLEFEAFVGTTGAGNLEVEYTTTDNWVVDFGVRTLDIDGATPGVPTTAQLTLTIPEGTDFLVEYLAPTTPVPDPGVGFFDPPQGPIELEFDAFDTGGIGFFTFDGENYELTAFELVAESLQPEVGIGNIGDYAFEAVANFPMTMDGGGDGEAFAYAESSAALDLL